MNRNKNIFIISITVSFLFLLISCNKNKIFEEYKKIDNYTWARKNTIEFNCNIEDTSCPYNIYLNIRHANLFPYKNIWLTLKVIKPNLTTNILDTVECILAEDNGLWLGDGLGDIWDLKYRWKIQDKEILSQKGNYFFIVNHLMRQDTVVGIMDIGLEIEKFEYKK